VGLPRIRGWGGGPFAAAQFVADEVVAFAGLEGLRGDGGDAVGVGFLLVERAGHGRGTMSRRIFSLAASA
jgi:hypothetical protein